MSARRWPAAALAMLVPCVLCLPALSPAVQLFYRDTGRLYYPVRKFIADELAKGTLPLWDPWTEAGTSLLAQVTPGLLHPYTLAYAVLPFDLAFKLHHLLTLPLAALGAWLLARRLSASPFAAAACGISYGSCGYLLSMASSNLPYALGAATVPFAVEGVLRFTGAPSPLRLFWAGLALSLCAYAGEPQAMLLAGVIGAACAVGVAAHSLRSAARAAALVALAGACGLALAGPVALPAAERLRASSRLGGVSKIDQGMFVTSPLRLPGLLIPSAFDDQIGVATESGYENNPYPDYFDLAAAFSDSIYLGAPALLLGLAGALATRRARWLFFGGALCALAATGPNLGILEAVTLLVPPLRWFRYAEKLIAPATLLFSLAAALGADAALSGDRKEARPLLALSAALAVAAAALAAVLRLAPAASLAVVADLGGAHHPMASAAALHALLGPALVSVATLAAATALCAALRLRREEATPMAKLLAAICCAAAAFAGSPGLLVGPLDLLHGPFPLAELFVARAGPSPGRWRVFTTTGGLHALDSQHDRRQLSVGELGVGLVPQFETLAGLQGAASYFSDPDLDYVHAISRAPYQSLRLLQTRFLVLMPGKHDRADALRRGFVPMGPGMLVRDLGPLLPSVLLRSGAQPYTKDRQGRLLAPDALDQERTALIAASDLARWPPLPALGMPGAGDGTLTSAGPRDRSLRVRAAGRAVVSLAEHFDPGWSALVDGAAAPVVRVDGMLLGVAVEAGEHAVHLRFWPRGLTAGLATLVAACLALLGWRTRQAMSPG